MRPVTVKTVCQSCGAPMLTEYVRLGTMADCPKCLRVTIPIVPEGGRYPETGYEITFSDFHQLLEYSEYRQAVAPLMEEWFGFAVTETLVGISLLNTAGEVLDPIWVHLRIQSDAFKQRALYGVAMSLLR